jgi:hypothetical protein
MWPVMRGSAKDGAVPQNVIEFDFDWPDRTDPKVWYNVIAQHGLWHLDDAAGTGYHSNE